jgi:DNA-binding NtrC family response regulator
VESELFGYEKGAFSGALNAKPGLFELAHQGTIFLDEVGELDIRMQVKLLRVLDGGQFFRLGGTRRVTTDVRVVAATNRHLDREAEAGTFREDVYHRLSQLEIRVPPLRARADDIPALAAHFLSAQERAVTLSPAAIRRLQDYHWPGNVRELRNVVTRAAVLCAGDEIQPADLQLNREAGAGRTTSAPRKTTLCLDELERETILQALDRTNGHHGRAATLLGISVRTLSRKLKAYDVEKTELAQTV